MPMVVLAPYFGIDGVRGVGEELCCHCIGIGFPIVGCVLSRGAATVRDRGAAVGCARGLVGFGGILFFVFVLSSVASPFLLVCGVVVCHIEII